MYAYGCFKVSRGFRFTAWPDDALLLVAENFISSMHLSSTITTDSAIAVDTDNARVSVDQMDDEDEDGEPAEIELSPLEKSLVDMVMFFKTSISEASDRFFMELGRMNYVTPTSYLEMLRSLKLLYGRKYNEITMKRDRYGVLQKIFAAMINDFTSLLDTRPVCKSWKALPVKWVICKRSCLIFNRF